MPRFVAARSSVGRRCEVGSEGMLILCLEAWLRCRVGNLQGEVEKEIKAARKGGMSA